MEPGLIVCLLVQLVQIVQYQSKVNYPNTKFKRKKSKCLIIYLISKCFIEIVIETS